jgi:hypothetical protein
MTGEPEEIRVSEIYKPDNDAGEYVEWFWINEVWEGYRIDKDIYIGIQPIAEQRNKMNNPSICKLPYNGRIYSNRNSDLVSVVSLGIPYQILYNIFHYRLEMSIAKNKDKIALMEINTIPKRHGWDEEKFMYHAEANGFAFIDSTGEGKNNEKVTFNGFQVMDMSLGNYIAAQFELLVQVKTEWEEMLGISRQRKGNIMASDGQGVTERAVYQSAIMTEDMFRKFETVEQRDLQGLVDVSQIAWSNGKKASYVRSDYSQAYLNINPELYCNADFGVFVVNSNQENEKLQQLKSLALEFAQNQSAPLTVAEILDAPNFSQIKGKLAQVEKAQREFEQAQAAAEQANVEAEQQMKVEEREDIQEFESRENELDRLNAEKIALINLEGKNQAKAPEGDTIPQLDPNQTAKNTLEREKLYATLGEQRSSRLADIAMREKELAAKREMEMEKLKVAEKKIAADKIKARAQKRSTPKK